MSNQPETTGYAPSSWNYGSFHPCNPYHQREQARHTRDQNDNLNKRSQSANLNHLGKRTVPEEEKIVTEGYLQMMKDFKAIKNCNNNNKNLKRNKSSAHFKGSLQSQYEITNENYNTSQNLNVNTSQISGSVNAAQNLQKSIKSINSFKSSKSFKFQLSWEEWAAVKAKQQEIFKKVKIIKESEDQNFEYFNQKVDENYKVIQDQNFNEWLQKKQTTKLLEKQKKMKAEEMKEMEKNRKQSENSNKLEEWCRRQAELMDHQSRMKKKNEEKQKAEQKRKQQLEEAKKARANEAFKIWMQKKEDEKVIEKRNNRTTTAQDKFKRKTTLSRTKVVIGPYTNAKDLKDIQKSLAVFKNSGTYYEKTDVQEENPQYSKENIEDSLQELSSIKKDSPEQEQEGDYY